MRKLKLLFSALALFGAMSASAQVMIETDLTSQFNSLATTQWTGSSGQVGWAAPTVTTNSGLTVAAWENYCGDWNGGCTNTGTIMKTTVTGLVPGTYKIELYGAAAFTFNRNFGSEAFTGDITVGNGSKATSDTYTAGQSITENTGVFLYATTSEGTYNNEIPIWYADNFNASGLSTAVLNGVVVGENGNIEIGMSKTSKSTNWHVVQLKGVTATVDAEATFATFKAEAEGLYNSPMKATILSELKTAANVDLSSADAEAYKTAIETLQAKISAAKTSVANYAEAKSILDAANGYDEAGQASYAADETIAAIQTAYTEGTLEAVTADQKTAANAALVVACKAQTQPANNCDMTAYLENPSFESGFTGWTNNGMQTQNNKAFGGTVDNYYCEAWQPNGTKSISQTIAGLPEGHYLLTVNSMARGVTSAKIYAGTAETPIPVADATNAYTVEFMVSKADVTIGFEGVGTGASTSWLCIDNFQLTYVSQLTEPEKLEISIAEYNAALAAAQALDGKITTYAKDALDQYVTANTVTDGTAAEYNAATFAINDAIETLQPLVEPYATWKALKAKADILAVNHPTIQGAIAKVSAAVEKIFTADLLNQANTATASLMTNYVAWDELFTSAKELQGVSNNNEDANEELKTAINTQQGIILQAYATLNNNDSPQPEDVNTLDQAVVSATATLKTAMVTYATTAEPTNDECFDLTFMIVNPHFTEGEGGNKAATGWTLESGEITEHRLLTHNFEAYHKQFNLSQTIPGLQKGTYKVTLQGFARHDNNGPTDKTNLYCGIVDQKIKDIKDEWSTTSIVSGKPAMGDNNGEQSYTVGDETRYQPNGMSGSYYFFQEENPATNQPFYTNEVQTIINQPGDLKIGFKCETNNDWVIWDNFHLYYYGSAIAVEINEESPKSYSEDVENANVTLKRTFKNNGAWNTFFVPFDLSEEETKAAFGDDVQVATFSETADGIHSTISFNAADDASIEANVPVLLKTSTTETEFTFNGKTIKAGEAKAAGTNFDFVGTYAASTTIAEGDYFIGSNKLFKSAGATTIKGLRAYLKKTESADPEARITKFFIDGEETTAIDGLKMAGNSGKIYNLNGQEVKNAGKGIFIQNGKKIVVK